MFAYVSFADVMLRYYTREIVRYISTQGHPYSRKTYFSINPRVSLVDERVSIKVHDLRPLQRVTVQAWVEEGMAVFSSCGHFQADQHGQVDIDEHASSGGTYKGNDSMGLFWSMKPVPRISKDPLLRKQDVTKPLVFRLSVIDGHVPLEVLHQGPPEILATEELEQWYKHRAVRRIIVRDGSLRGTLFLPEGKGPFPGIIDMFGSTGGLKELRAALLASRGFASFALPYFGYDDLPPSLAGFDFDYLLGAVDWLSSHQSVRRGGIGVVGTSKGGELALLLGMATNKVKALVNITGPPFYSFADLKKSGQVFWKGVKLPAGKLTQTDEGIYLRDIDASYGDIIPAWKNNAKILYLCGDDDGMWADTYAEKFMETCPEEKRKNIELIIYPGAGHLIEPPYMPVCRTSYHNKLGMTLVMGGQLEGHAVAQEDAWKRLLEFFRKHLQ